MSETEIIDSGIELPLLGSIEALPDFSLRVTWAAGSRSGVTEIVDLRPALGSFKIYKPLRGNPPLFSTVRLADDGNAVSWDGKDLEMSAEMLLSWAEQAMRPQDFAAFLKRNGLTQEAAAALLGRSRRQIANYLAAGPIPRIVALACYGFEARQRDREIARTLQDAAASFSDPTGNDKRAA
ncbi:MULTISPECIES: hypothetical protein [Rhodopseudomonas]|uniref:hypothetical protein n=1 Tax=Rhodopseudomonas TaxID=1073 RepID=UPI000A71DB6F|nr:MULTISPECIES: hypothetical protein [Rhodopseudomonas]MDF3810121.1 hypothetical protein [Rhodopseudomonas sp. BAL398]WOK19300.1 hypothetical protein RBJ75_07225 [Rhodopseudomonas sp. BAL398]